MDITALINEYKKIDFNDEKNGRVRRNVDKYINFLIIYLFILSVLYYCILQNTIIINISASIVFFLFLTSGLRKKSIIKLFKEK